MPIRVSNIRSRTGNNISFTNGLTIPAGVNFTTSAGTNTLSINSAGVVTCSSVQLTSTTNFNFTGIVTAAQFIGDGKNLTNIPGIRTSLVYSLNSVIN